MGGDEVALVLEGREVARVPSGEVVTRLEADNGQMKVRWKEIEGWTEASQVALQPPLAPAEFHQLSQVQCSGEANAARSESSRTSNSLRNHSSTQHIEPPVSSVN